MEIRHDVWLSTALARDVFRVDHTADPDDGTGALEEHMVPRPNAMYVAKIDTTAMHRVAALSALGFSVVDVQMTFGATPCAVRPMANDTVIVECAVPADHAPVLDVAGSCFRYSRFHLDPSIPDLLAHSVKRAWIASYLEKRRGDSLLVARVRGEVAGFLAAMTADGGRGRTATIDLIGVAASLQRQGVGAALVRAFATRYVDNAELVVGTQAANIPSIRLYERLGFRLTGSAYVLHCHVPPVAP